MRIHFKSVSILILVLAAIIVPLIIFLPASDSAKDDPWAYLPQKLPSTDHSALMKGPYEDGPAVTRACLECHKDAGQQMLQSAHFTWESPPVEMAGHSEPVVLGKKYAVNNFCIGISSNWPACTSCHAGYGWEDDSYDFSKVEHVDCLVCHDNSGAYVKTISGQPSPDVDLVEVAQSVGGPSRNNCGTCHFRGGGGNAVKHGDLDETLYYPPESVDVHMGKHDFLCTDCHQTQNHEMKGRAISVSADDANQVYCTDCHSENLHKDERINAHVASVACQTCHIPLGAVKEATKMHWDWSAAGQDIPEDPHHYLKKKGKFEYEKKFVPEYYWYNGRAEHYVMGDKINTEGVTAINRPRGGINDPGARIWPFKVHRATQIYDVHYQYLLQPKTYGEEGYWTDFDWDKAVRLGSEAVGMEYSGEYGFTETIMFWPTTHMVAPTESALQCADCHGENGAKRMDWQALGYDGDPLHYGGRAQNRRMTLNEEK